jgi:hypothetical protein
MSISEIDDESICQQFAKIIGGQEGFAGGKYVATINQDELDVTILKKHFRVTTSFSVESRDNSGRALCLGRIALLQKEVDEFVAAILSQGIKTKKAVKINFTAFLISLSFSC